MGLKERQERVRVASTVLSELDKIADDGGKEAYIDGDRMFYLKQNHSDVINWTNLNILDKPMCYGIYRDVKIHDEKKEGAK